MLTTFSEDSGSWHFFHLTKFCDQCRIQFGQNQGYNYKTLKLIKGKIILNMLNSQELTSKDNLTSKEVRQPLKYSHVEK